MIKLLATDLDGTLFTFDNNKEIIKEENIKMLQKFHNEGGKVAIVTGRGPFYTNWVSQKLGFPCFDLSLNGASNSSKIIPNEIVEQIIKKLKQFDKSYSLLLSSKDGKMYSLINKYFIDTFLYLKKRDKKYVNKLSKTKFSNKKIQQIIKENQVKKIIINFKNKDNHHQFYSYLEEYLSSFSLYYYKDAYEINPKGCSKGEALIDLIDELNFKKEDVFVIGDSKNDVSMFDVFKNSASFSYSLEEIQEKTKYVVDKFLDIEPYLY